VYIGFAQYLIHVGVYIVSAIRNCIYGKGRVRVRVRHTIRITIKSHG